MCVCVCVPVCVCVCVCDFFLAVRRADAIVFVSLSRKRYCFFNFVASPADGWTDRRTDGRTRAPPHPAGRRPVRMLRYRGHADTPPARCPTGVLVTMALLCVVVIMLRCGEGWLPETRTKPISAGHMKSVLSPRVNPYLYDHMVYPCALVRVCVCMCVWPGMTRSCKNARARAHTHTHAHTHSDTPLRRTKMFFVLIGQLARTVVAP